MNTRFLSLTAILAAGTVFLGVNIIGNSALRGMRLDLTENSLYTLTQGSRAIASKIDEPITLKLYFTPEQAQAQPVIKSYYTRVSEMLREYAAASGGKIKLRIIDPKPYTEEQDEADQAGLFGAPVGGAAERLYFGLVGENSTDRKEIIPFFDSSKEEFLEYEITRMVYLLSSPEKRAVGLMASLPVEGMEQNPMMGGRGVPPWQIVTQLKDYFNVQKVATDAAAIPDDVNVLLLIHPKNLPDQTLYAIDQFVMRGGRLMVFVDPWCEADLPPGVNAMQAMGLPRDSNLTKLFDAWGIQVAPQRVAADRERAIQVGVGNPSRPEAVDYVVYMSLREDNVDKKDPSTGTVQSINLATAGVISKRDGASIELHPLLRTGTKSMTVGVESIQFMPDPKKLLAEFVEGGEPLTLAARVTGKLTSAFPQGDPTRPAAEGQPPAAGHLAETREPASLIVVGDCDMLTDRFWVQENRLGNLLLGYQKIADNGDFVIGAIDNLSGSSDLMSVRARGRATRPFERVQAMQKDAQKKHAAKEQELQARLTELERKLTEMLRNQTPGSALMLTPEQKAEIDSARTAQVETRKELRSVQSQLRADIDKLGTRLKILNIAAMPIFVGLAAMGLSAYRVGRRRAVKANSRT